MLLFRGFRDTLPSKIDYRTFDGLYGTGVYLTLRDEVAFRYGPKSADVFGIIASYVPTSPVLFLKEGVHFNSKSNLEKEMRLTSAGRSILNTKEKSIQTSSLMAHAQAVGYNVVQIELDYCCERTVVASGYEHIEFQNFQFYINDEVFDDPSEDIILKKIEEYQEWFNSIEEV
jgi:hypothetical protein